MRPPERPDAESLRREALEPYLDFVVSPGSGLDALTDLAARICEAPICLVSLVDTDRVWFKSKLGLKEESCPRDLSFCGHAILQNDPFVVPDTTKDERFADNPFVEGGPQIRFYAGFSLRRNGGPALGTLCVMDHVPRMLNELQFEALRALSQQVMSQLELHRRARELSASEARLKLFVDHSPTAVAMLDREMRYLVVSRRWMEAYRLGEQSIVGRCHYNVFPEIQPRWKEIHRRCLAGAIERSDGEEFKRADGSVNWIRWEVRPWYRADDSIGGIMIFSEDITSRQEALLALRESEERFRQLAENIQEVFWMTDPEKNEILYISPAYEGIWGRPCEEVYRSPQTWLEAIHPEDRGRVLQAARTKQARGDYDENYRVCRPDGSIRWIHDRAFPVRDEAGNVIRVVGIAEDVTGRRTLEDQVRQAQKLEAIGLLAGGIAHDFNNVLAAILGNAEVGRLDLPKEHPVQTYLNHISTAASRATLLVRQILAFSRRQVQQRTVISLAPVVKESAALMRATIPAGISILKRVDAHSPPVMADATQIHQIVVNLCTNSWHAMDNQPGRIEIELKETSLDDAAVLRMPGLKPGRHVVLSVMDTGKGMDAETKARIFDPFFTTKPVGQGTGLGLSVVHGIVQEHEGAINVITAPGMGTTFEIFLPVAPDAEGVADRGSAKPVRGAGQHILYIDDEEPLVFIAGRMLERLGYKVSGFTDGARAIEAFHENPEQFALVVTDLNMPGMTGLEVAARILNIRPETTVALTSGHVTEALREQAHEAGIRELMRKPNTIDELSAEIHRLLSSH